MKEENINEWLRLCESGQVAEAEDFYYSTLFIDVIDQFCERHKILPVKCNVLFSLLGYSPEPIILTQRALNPDVHVIFTTDLNDQEASKKIKDYLGEYLTSEFKIIEIHDKSFHGIYTCLKEQMLLNPSQNYVIDITGGKKSMVASAAIFGRDYNCNIVYVDYSKYLPHIRKPLPGSETLNCVYMPSYDLPEIKFFVQNKIKEEANIKIEKKRPSIIEFSNSIREKFNVAYKNQVGDNKTEFRYWLTNEVRLTKLSDLSIMFMHKKTGQSITIQRTELLDFYCKCKYNKADAYKFIKDKSLKADRLNKAIHGLLAAINHDLFNDHL